MLYILLPAYNEEESIDYIFPKFKNYLENEYKTDYKIIICNDGSKDKTLEKIEKYRSSMPIEVINHKINRGLGETARDLFEYVAEVCSDEDIIIRLDCDDTHEPVSIKGLIDKLNEGNDVVIASRFVPGGGQQGLNTYRKTISRLANYFMKFFFPIKGLKEYSSGFRAYRGSLIKKAISFYGNDFIQLKGLGFTCTLEKIIKLRILNARFGEAPMVLKYDQKRSPSKMIGSLTTMGYLAMVVLYYWPWGGWRIGYKKKLKK
ncbi:MAG: glycosyltransferase [Bacteroidota bacterium]